MPDATTDATSGRSAPVEDSADATPLTTGSVPDTEVETVWFDENQRRQYTRHGTDEPAALIETPEQGAARTGRSAKPEENA